MFLLLLAAAALAQDASGCMEHCSIVEDLEVCIGGDLAEHCSGGSPAEQAVERLLADALRDDGWLDPQEAERLAAFARRHEGVNEAVLAQLRALLEDGTELEEGARSTLQATVSGARPADVPLSNEVYEVQPGSQPFLFDDTLVLRGDGRVQGQTGLMSHSRGYAAKRDGVLFTRHGSLAPHYDSTASLAETEALRRQGPDQALDRAAEILGLELDAWSGFSHIARDPNFYDPSDATPFWAGICQGWTHNALDDRLSALVDVPGAEGRRGLWILGQWISRADLGNALMGASYSLSIADSTTIDSFVTPESLVKGLAQYVLASGRGMRVDIWNDEHNANGHYDPQIWNQPVVAAAVEVESVSAAAEEAVLAYAGSQLDLPEGARVRLVRASARWGAETRDDWEGEPAFRDSEWNSYMVTDAEGRVLKGWMAHDLVAAGLRGLPVTTSDGLPDYIAIPKHELTDASFEGGEHRLLDSGHGDGLRYRFLVGTVLARGIPDTTREAFEAEAFAGGADPVELAQRYPGIANAYSPAQWAAVFEPRLGPGAEFGALWDVDPGS
jgi:hypothetical protein